MLKKLLQVFYFLLLFFVVVQLMKVVTAILLYIDPILLAPSDEILFEVALSVPIAALIFLFKLDMITDIIIRLAIKRHKFNTVAKVYRFLSKHERNVVNKNNLLGIAALYEHDANKAIDYLSKSYRGAIGVRNLSNIGNNLAIAYLQNGWYNESLKLLESQRERGYLIFIAYIISLLACGKVSEAKQVFEQNSFAGKKYVRPLIDFDPRHNETLENIRFLLESEKLWIYQPAIKYIYEQCMLEVFFQHEDRYQELQKEGYTLLEGFSRDPQFFKSATLQYLRSLLVKILPKVGTYEDCASLYGIIDNMDSYVATLEIDSKLKQDYISFWRKVLYLFWRTRTLKSFDIEYQPKFIKEQQPDDANQIMTYTNTCCLYISDTLGIGIRSYQVNDYGMFYTEIISMKLSQLIIKGLEPIRIVLDSDPNLSDKFRQLAYRLVADPFSITSTMVTDVLSSIPKQYHEYFNELKENVSQLFN